MRILFGLLAALARKREPEPPTAEEMYDTELNYSIHVTPNHPPVIPQRKTLFISAGHSDAQPGAVGHGYTEAMIVLEFRDLVADALRNKGVTFDKDGFRRQNLPLSDAIREAKAHDVAIEFHCNAAASTTATGVETLSDPKHYPLCTKLNETVSRVLGIRNRGEKPENSGQHSRLGFISTGGGIIHELFFISNADDLRRYKQNKHELAQEIADVLAREVR
jgi:N-acetylmuramoyl-L-alanine amidase